MRMKFFRIFPDMCASTWCLFSSSTRNIAFGSGSITVAMTSMASSLGNRFFPRISRGRHIALHFFAVDKTHQLPRHLVCGRAAIKLPESPGLLVILHQGIGLFAVMHEPLLNLSHHI